VAGGTSITLCDEPDGFSGASWGTDDTIVFGSSKGLLRVPAAGGTPQSLTAVNTNNGETRHSSPEFLPGGQAVLFTVFRGASSVDASQVAVLDLKTRAYRVQGGREGRYVPSGHLVYVRGERGRMLFAVPFDLKRLAVTGSERPAVEGMYFGHYAFSDSSLLVYVKDRPPTPTTLEWTDRKGVAEALPEPPHGWLGLRVSPDGRRVAAAIEDENASADDLRFQIYVYDIERRTLTPLTFEGTNTNPVWTPDDRWVTFASRRVGKEGIYRIAADKSGQPELLAANGSFPIPECWTPDGKTLIYTDVTKSRSQIWMLQAGSGSENKPRLFSQTSNGSESQPQISPDGKWLAYQSNESGKYEIYVVSFPGPGSKFQISTHPGLRPMWSRSGRELFYIERGTNQLMAVDVQPDRCSGQAAR
jgi:serine/threonine-protein kinase